MIMWLFAKLNDDRASAQERIGQANSTTTVRQTTTSSTTIVVDDSQRLCSLASAFRADLQAVDVQLVNLAGTPISATDGPMIDVGLHKDGDIPLSAQGDRIIGATDEIEDSELATATSIDESAIQRVPPPEIIDVERIDPLASGLLGEPQEVALNFYSAAAALRLGLITADFEATSDYFSDFVQIGEPASWNLDELAESDFSDRWTALTTQPVVGVDATLAYIEEACSIRIGTGFVYREEPPELPVLEQVLVPALIDPSVDPSFDPSAPGTTQPPANNG